MADHAPPRIFAAAERLMSMSDEVWARHANPWSVWTRFTCLPLIVLALWSRVWLGWWCLIPLALACLWTWANPRVFPPATDWETWPARGTSGERVWIARDIPVARHHHRAAIVLTWASAAGLPVLVYGVWVLNVWATIAGLTLVVLPKLWFVDRMVWIWLDFERAGGRRADLDKDG